MPRCRHRRPRPSVQGREEALVRVYAGAPAGVAGLLHGLPRSPGATRACRGENTRTLAVSWDRDYYAYTGGAAIAFDMDGSLTKVFNLKNSKICDT